MTTGIKHIYDEFSPTNKAFHFSSNPYFMVTKHDGYILHKNSYLSLILSLTSADLLFLLWFPIVINLCFELLLMSMVKIPIASGLYPLLIADLFHGGNWLAAGLFLHSLDSRFMVHESSPISHLHILEELHISYLTHNH